MSQLILTNAEYSKGMCKFSLTIIIIIKRNCRRLRKCLLVIFNILQNEISNLTGKHVSHSNLNSSRTIKNNRKIKSRVSVYFTSLKTLFIKEKLC